MIFSRKVTKIYRNKVFTRHNADGSIYYFSVVDFDGLKSEEYSFKNQKGETLRGAFYYYDNPKSDRLIVFDHGMGTGHNAYMKEIEMLARHGFVVYSYDHTGCTLSEGEGIRGLSGSLSDLDACITALISERGYKEENISVIGHSWGAFSTMNIALYHPNLRSIVAMSGFISVKEIQKQSMRGILSLFRSIAYKTELSENGNYAEANAIDTLSGSDIPALIIHSADDKTVSAKRNFDKLKNAIQNAVPRKHNVKFVLLDGKGHNPNYTRDAVIYKDAFFEDLKMHRKKNLLSTDEDKKRFIEKYDWHKMTEQDTVLWDIIFEHLDN